MSFQTRILKERRMGTPSKKVQARVHPHMRIGNHTGQLANDIEAALVRKDDS